jgi:polar amino acid transport system substrate-binding protein
MTAVFAYLDEPPFCAPGADGPVGCDVDVAFAVLRAIGIERTETRLVTFGRNCCRVAMVRGR